ncbi:MAG: radical SAM protein [Cyanobacteria bacterium J06638_22]
MNHRTAAFQLLPITFNGLVIENTNRCNAKCSMCYQSSGPHGSDIFGKHHLKNSVIKKAMKDAQNISALESRFHLAGGESFLEPESCFELFEYAKFCGYKKITTTTNCYWGYKLDSAKSFAKRMKISGVTQIEISWDIWHLPYIKPDSVNNAIIACSEQGIYTNLRVLATKSHSIEEALLLLSSDALNLVDEISTGAVFRTGRAKVELDAGDFFSGTGEGGNCHSVLHLTVNARGDVYPCCAGADQTDSLSFGNIHNESISNIYSVMNNSRLLRTLVFQGVGAFVPILEAHGFILDQSFGNICNLCWNIFSNAEYSKIIKDHFKDLDEIANNKLLSALETN